jgi:DNA-directed RNA polymerase subunit E'/Rpb7
MSTVIKKPVKFKTKKRRKKDIWVKNVLTRKILLPFQSVGNNIRENIQIKLEKKLYNKCSKEGYIRKKSITILSYSSGLVEANNVIFDVMFECDICHPVEGQIIKCTVQNITRAGIRATYIKEEVSPITIFVARDHHYNNEAFSKIKEDEEILIKVIGIRYELNDETISVLGELKPAKINKAKIKTKVTVVEE